MAFVYWALNADDDWSNAADWSGGLLPTSNDVVTISTTSIHTVTHSIGDDFVGRLSVGNDIFQMAGGSLDILGVVSMATGMVMSDGLLTFESSAAITKSFVQNGGSLIAAGSVAVTGTATLLGGYLGGDAVFTASSTVVLGNDYTLGGDAQLRNAHTVNQTGDIILGDDAGINVTIANLAGATYNFANAVTIGSGAATATLSNAGTLAALAGTGVSVIDVSVGSTGQITVGAGATLMFQGPLTTLGGSVSGAGTLAFGGGAATIAVGTTLSAAGLSVSGDGTRLTLGGNTTVAGSFSQSDQSSLALGAYTLTLNGPAQFEDNYSGPTVTGSGTLVTKGGTTIATAYGNSPGLTIGGSAAWNNYGTVVLNTSVQIGSSSTAAASVVNLAGGVFNLTAAGITIGNGSTPMSSFSNAGTLEMTANGGTSTVGVNVTSGKAIIVAQGDNLEFDGLTNSISGSITGAGQVSFGAGRTILAAGTVISVGTLALYDSVNGSSATMALGGNVTVSGGFSQTGGATVALGSFTLTLSGAALFQQYDAAAIIAGSGTLVTKGVTTLGNYILGGSVAWNNYGTVIQNQELQIGNSSTAAASLVNEAGGVFNIATPSISIDNGSTQATTLTNAGLVEMTAVGSSSINLAVANTGTLLAKGGGNLTLTGAVSGAGGVIALSGGGSVSVSATVASTQTVKFLDATGSLSIGLTTPTSFAATISGFVKGDTIDLGNVTNATAKFSGGVLTFTDNTTHLTDAVLHFTGTPNFTFASDGNGGTLIGDPPLSAAALKLSDKMYFTNSGSGKETIAVTGKSEALIGGFSFAHPDVLDLRTLLAGTPAAHDLGNIGHYLTATSSGGNTTLMFDPTGHGHGSAVAMLTDITTTVTSLMAHHSLNL